MSTRRPVIGGMSGLGPGPGPRTKGSATAQTTAGAWRSLTNKAEWANGAPLVQLFGYRQSGVAMAPHYVSELVRGPANGRQVVARPLFETDFTNDKSEVSRAKGDADASVCRLGRIIVPPGSSSVPAELRTPAHRQPSAPRIACP
jgi:hypothetical protein